jgi:hypothetical protein
MSSEPVTDVGIAAWHRPLHHGRAGALGPTTGQTSGMSGHHRRLVVFLENGEERRTETGPGDHVFVPPWG